VQLMASRLEAGQRVLAGAGLEAAGFCAPGWLGPPALPRLLRRLGFGHFVGMATLTDLLSERRLRMPWLGYMGAGAAQERLLGLGGGATRAIAPFVPAVKVFLHPQAAPDSEACTRVLRTLAELVQDRCPVTYAQLLAR